MTNNDVVHKPHWSQTPVIDFDESLYGTDQVKQ